MIYGLIATYLFYLLLPALFSLSFEIASFKYNYGLV